MPRFTQHEFLDAQEHVRSAVATAHTCRQMAQLTNDADLRTICENEARVAEQTAIRLMSLIQGEAH